MASLTQFDRRRGADRPGIAGVDEAGRGALAGPVVAASVWLDGGFYGDASCLRRVRGANDSKILSASDRDDLRARIESLRAEGKLRVAWAACTVMEIATLNILGATRAAMARCLAEFDIAARPSQPFAMAGTDSELFGFDAQKSVLVLVDGLPLRPFVWAHEAIKQGDGKSLAIALASIVAKVERDRLMVELDAKYPAYGFAVHKGYAVPQHVEAIKAHGPCPEHRELFLRKILAGETMPSDEQSEFEF
jgi:ribonuclease HII